MITDIQAHLLIVEDDDLFRDTLRDYLSARGYQVSTARDATIMDPIINRETIDLLILDVMLPGEDGLSIAKRLRANKFVAPILILSALNEEVDRVVGLEIGADDYLSKPTSLREVLARVRALLRRMHMQSGTDKLEPIPPSYCFGDFVLNLASYQFLHQNQQIHLSKSEFELLRVFVENPNQVLNRDKLSTLLKGREYNRQNRSIDVKVRRLRTKMEEDPAEPAYIRTVHSVGYMFCPEGAKTKDKKIEHDELSELVIEKLKTN
ncbi:response regulator [Candidatus Venteria ishoeyi]|uniref:response regulator n=1 Tax=Candidatus Venteria ishoeyi TaxID=1899563 RepID=UPI0025A59038|nr:response regulator [Candidatus Venteria ishoeyi]MDM8545797.1 response regulator [Candidatus Venteria ishoeyi]